MSLYKNTKDYASIPHDLHQLFKVFVGANYVKSVLIEKRLEQEITTSGIKVCEYLYQVTFATKEQLMEFCKANGYFTGEPVKIEKGIDKLLKSKIINAFYFTEEEQIEPYNGNDEEALLVYCPTQGTCYLLDNFSTIETYGWDKTQIYKISGLITKQLTATRFYNYLQTHLKDKLMDFVSRKHFSAKTDGVINSFTTDFAFTIYSEESEGPKYFVGDVFREYDSVEAIRMKIRTRDALLNTKAWKRYYPDVEEPPVYICCVQNMEMLQFMAEEINENGGIRLVPIYYLEEWYDKDLGDNVFLTYDSTAGTFNKIAIKEFQ